MANEVSRLLRERHSDAPWAEKLHELGDIVATACLCHDLGNPPFGHSGEKTISTFFSEGEGLELKPLLTERQWADLINFEGERQLLPASHTPVRGKAGRRIRHDLQRPGLNREISALVPVRRRQREVRIFRIRRRDMEARGRRTRNTRTASWSSRAIPSSTSWRPPTTSAIRSWTPKTPTS